MNRDALQQRLTVNAAAAGRSCPSLASKNLTPHVLRHTAAMRLPGTTSPSSRCGSATNSIQPPPTASPHSTPSATPSPEKPGYRHSPPSADTSSRHPVNGHDAINS